MSDYYMLECYASPEQWEYTSVDGPPPSVEGVESWLSGRPFGVKVREPIELSWDPDTRGPRKYLYDAGIPLYHRAVCAALSDAGVDNLQTYRTSIVDPRSGEICRDYLAVNVVGLVAAADLGKSVYQAHSDPPLIDSDFDSLVIDPARASGLLMFRLAECVSGVVVHRRVKEALEARGGFGLTFVPPQAWIG
ncbi:hypothetical protein [Sorangium sp. So ce1099]|uniref:hypothetical protein n=1 Tax=Sorangium sp. So ce1099 TaxID=3133331 RepID=UPI003F5EF2E2